MQQSATTSGLPGDRSSSQGWKTGVPGDGASPPEWEIAPPSPSFAGLLAALATPASAAPERAPAWNDDDLEEDVATLSYERALRTHTRYRAADPSDRSLTQAADFGPIHIDEPSSDTLPPAAQSTTPRAATAAMEDAEPWATRGPSTALDRNLKRASITVRLSKAECAQLHKRAAEAGLTVSAYLRSCTFEAESLRALVKDTLAQLRLATSKGNRTDSAPPRRSRLGWLWRLLPRWHSSQRIGPVTPF